MSVNDIRQRALASLIRDELNFLGLHLKFVAAPQVGADAVGHVETLFEQLDLLAKISDQNVSVVHVVGEGGGRHAKPCLCHCGQ